MDTSDTMSRRTLRLPQDATTFLDRIAAANCTSVNAEIVRSVRERMERAQAATGEKFGDRAPAAVNHSTALPGGAITHG